MRVMVTGATGFLGSHVVKALLRKGHCVVVLKRSFSDCTRIADVMPALVSYDLDQVSIETPFLEQGAIDAVIHTATAYGRKNEGYLAVAKSNVTFPLALLEASIRSGTPVFINTDTFSNIAWRAPTRLIAYHLTKKHFAEWGKCLSKNHSVRFVTVRLEHLFGPYDAADKFVPFLVKSCLEHVPEIKLTPGEQKRDFVHVDDVVSAYMLLLQKKEELPLHASEFQVGSGVATSIKEFAEQVHRLTGSRAKLNFGGLPYPAEEIMFSQADVSALAKWGWRSAVSLEEGIRSVICEQKKRGQSQ